MPKRLTLLALCLLLASSASASDNPVFDKIEAEGLTIEGTTVRLPSATFTESQNAEASRKALKTVVGDDRAVEEFLRDSVTAPFILKTRDVKAGDSTIRIIDLWFAVHARLDDIDPDQALRQNGDQVVEAGNMRFESKLLSEQDLLERKVARLAPLESRKEWFTHVKGRLLDRILVEITDHAVASRTKGSLLIAAQTDRAFDNDPRFPNRWMSLSRKGAEEIPGPSRIYPGSLSYVKMTPLAGHEEILLVESHMAFVEPQDWFQGNPILRSKIGVISQDQIRRLRREIQKKRRELKEE